MKGNTIKVKEIYHSFFGLGITLWLGFVRKFGKRP